MALDYVEIAMLARSAADPTVAKNLANVFQFRRLGPVATPSKSEINTAFQTAIGDKVLLAVNVDYQQTFNTVRFFDDALDPAIPFVQAGVGAIAGERQPDFVTASIRLKGNVRSRSGRGRKSFGPIAEADTTGDALTAGAITRFTTVATAILAGFTDASGNIWKPVVKSGKPPAQYEFNPVVVVAYDVISTSVNTPMGSLVRRKVRA